MSLPLDDLFRDLDGVINPAGRLGDLTPRARSFLALPRYADAGGAELLARDIEEIIDEIDAAASGVEKLHKAARLLFHMDMPSTPIKNRREPMHTAHGSADKWMDAAIVSRVLAGLVERIAGGGTQGIASVGLEQDHLELYRVTSDGRIEHMWYPDDDGRHQWSDWYDLDFEHGALDVAAVASSPTRIGVFVLDLRGTVWHREWSSEGRWSEGFETLGTPFRGPAIGIATASLWPGHVDVQVESRDGAVANLWCNDETWDRHQDDLSLADGWSLLGRAGARAARDAH